MSKHQIETISIVNKYLTMCKLENPDSYNAKIAQQYLSKKVSESLNFKNKDNFKVGVIDLLRISF